MATMKKAQTGATVRNTAKNLDNAKTFSTGKNLPERSKGFKSVKDPDYKPSTKKYKNGGSLGMKSVKAGYDKNPGVTRADIITAAKKAQNGVKVNPPAGATPGSGYKAFGKSGTTIKKAQSGIMAKASKAISGAADTASKWIKSHQTGGAETERQRRISAKSGKSMKKCKTGCK